MVLNYEVFYRHLDSESETKPDISNINRLIKVNVYSVKSCNPFTKWNCYKALFAFCFEYMSVWLISLIL